MQRTARLALFATIALLGLSDPASATLYDVDWSSPPHNVGYPPAISYGPAVRRSPTQIIFGNPLVVSALGAMTEQPLQFDSWDGSTDQVEFRLDDLPIYEFYSLESDVLVESAEAGGAFTLLFAGPAVRRIDFESSGTVSQFVSGLPYTPIGSYTIGTIVHLKVDINLVTDTWAIYLDNALAWEGDFGSSSELDDATFSTSTIPLKGVRAAIDNVTITEDAGETLCDRVTMRDLVNGTQYNVGDEFMTEGVAFSVSEFYDLPGNCVANVRNGFIQVVAQGQACQAGKELNVNNATLNFNFGAEVSDVLVPFGEYGGTVLVKINGDCEVVENFSDLNGTFLGGVAITAFNFGVPGQSCGVLRLGGTIETLAIGGQELWLDNISYCNACPDLRRSAFDDQVAGVNYSPGDSFVSGAARHRFRPYYQPAATCQNFFNAGIATTLATQTACGDGLELRRSRSMTKSTSDRTSTGWPSPGWRRLGSVNLVVNGDCANLTNLDDINGTQLGGCSVWATPYDLLTQPWHALRRRSDPPVRDRRPAALHRQRAGLARRARHHRRRAPIGTPTDRVTLLENAPNPFGSTTRIRFALPRAGQTRVTIHDVSGRLVRSLLTESLDAGVHDVAWDGRTDARPSRPGRSLQLSRRGRGVGSEPNAGASASIVAACPSRPRGPLATRGWPSLLWAAPRCALGHRCARAPRCGLAPRVGQAVAPE
ncbi:MAG: FlgD immunoglobulin-like domain containing protein [Candidatus Eisenbacteria bacterium]